MFDLGVHRREFVATVASGSLCGWLGQVATAAEPGPRPKACILLWMAGGPSHIDTFDPKPDAPVNVRGEFQAIDTSVPGIHISEHFPKFARLMKHAAILRGMSTQESDHKLATYHLHTGYRNRGGAVAYPSLGALVAKELGRRDVPLPNFVTIGRGTPDALDAGFLGPDYQPLGVSDPGQGLDFIEPHVTGDVFQRQVELWRRLEQPFREAHSSDAGKAHRTALEQAVRLMNSEQKQAFDLSREPAEVQSRYSPRGKSGVQAKAGGKFIPAESSGFGQGCLMARRLVETGVPFVEVVMGDGVGWDTHRDNFPRTRALSGECDTAMSALVEDLRERGLLETTLVVWMGEFGRSPQCGNGGRNHWSRAWSTVLIGGGIKGGQIVGKTDRDGAVVTDRAINVPDFLATVYTLLGIDYRQKNNVPGVDRPVPLVDTSKPVEVLSELL